VFASWMRIRHFACGYTFLILSRGLPATFL
jgi:hypothetical protein